MDKALRCQVSRGMFSGEVAIRGTDANGVAFSMFVSENHVDAPALSDRDTPIDGFLHVEVLAREGQRALVKLPAKAFENGQTVTVNESQLTPIRRPQSA